MTLLITSCETDDDRGQFATDGTPPGKVTDIKVLNEKGSSVLTYTTPQDADLLYVEAKYNNSSGKETIVRASAFTNTMQLNGFLRSEKIPVEVFAVDKSFNKSKITPVEIEPLDSAIFDVLDSMSYQAIFGGVEISWENEAEQDIVIEFLRFNKKENTYDNYRNTYSKAPSLDVSIRGLNAKKTDFAILIRDEFEQRTDTLKFEATPLYEEQIDPKKFRELPNNPNFDTSSYSYDFSTLFDKVVTSIKVYSIFGDDIGKVYFTMDLGDQIKLSRFKLWSRPEFIYEHSQPRHIVLLGTNNHSIASDPESETGWETLGEWYDEKPSGNPANVPATEEDEAAFNNGIDFELDINVGSYRYLRFVSLESWGKTDRLWLAELRFWGQKN